MGKTSKILGDIKNNWKKQLNDTQREVDKLTWGNLSEYRDNPLFKEPGFKDKLLKVSNNLGVSPKDLM